MISGIRENISEIIFREISQNSRQEVNQTFWGQDLENGEF